MEEIVRRRQTEFTAERDWERFHKPRSLLLALVGEVGELAELFQWKEEVLPGLPGWRPQERARVADELADVLIYLTELAAVCHVDLPRAVLTKMAQNACKYPAEKVRGSSKKYNEYTEEQNAQDPKLETQQEVPGE
uniref:dCTP pyrophosphatase 1 n=1 Tax=Eptatretus burgeri TaxID=7764 RepID=A0A8C4R1I7_EPTBU